MRATHLLWLKLLSSAAASALCYALLFVYEKQVMASFTRTDGWYPLLSVATAFLFSLTHGAFTGYFWEALGVRARPAQPQSDATEVAE